MVGMFVVKFLNKIIFFIHKKILLFMQTKKNRKQKAGQKWSFM